MPFCSALSNAVVALLSQIFSLVDTTIAVLSFEGWSIFITWHHESTYMKEKHTVPLWMYADEQKNDDMRAADLREGPCGSTFVEAFSCYIRSEPTDGLEKGMDCLDQFRNFQECLKRNPDHVEKIMSDAEEIVADEDNSDGDNTGLERRSGDDKS